MRQKILSCIIAVNLILSSLLGTSVAIFADSGTSTMSLTAGRVEMQLSEIAGDGLTTDMNALIVNEGDINADLWLENIYRQQNDAAEFESNDPSGMTASGNAEVITVEVLYKNGKTSFFINDLDQHDAPLLLLEGIEPGSDVLVTIRQNTTEPATATTAPELIDEAVLSMQELSEPATEAEETSATQTAVSEPTDEAAPSMPDLSELAAEAEETPAMPAADDPVDPSDPPVEAQPENTTEPAVIRESLAEESLPDAYYEQLSVPIPYIFEFILKSGTFTSLTGESVFTLTKLFEVICQSAEPVVVYEETPATPAADEPLDPSGPPVEAQPENATEPTAIPTAPELAVEAAPSMPDLSEPFAEPKETTATQPAADPVDPSDSPAEAQPENSTEPSAMPTAPEATVPPTDEAAPSLPELSEFGG